MKPALSILVVNYVAWRECVNTLKSFVAHPPRWPDGSPMTWEIVVIDNASPNRDAEAEAEIERIVEQVGGKFVMHDENGGYSTGMNLALSHARGDFILVSNPDIIVKENTISQLVAAVDADDTVGAALPEIFWDEGLTARLPPNILPTLRDLLGLSLAAISRRWLWRYSRKRTRGAVEVWTAGRNVDLNMLSGCFFLMKRSFIEELGMFFDERFPLYYEDTDLSIRIRKAGKRILQVHQCNVVHLYNRSGQTDFAMALRRYDISRRRYFRKWYGLFGQTVFDVLQRILKTKWARRRNERPPHPDIVDLGKHNEKPLILLPKSCGSFLVEFALDPYFYLAGGTFGSGDRWTTPDTMFMGFGPTTYFFRVVDLDDADQPVIGVFQYTQVAPQVFDEMPEIEWWKR